MRKLGLFLAYTISSAAFVLFNRALLRRFHHPLFVTAVQQTIVAASYVAIVSRRSFPSRGSPSRWFRLEAARKIWVCAVFFVIMVAMNNMCLRFTPVSSYVIARASTLVFNMLLTTFFLNQPPTVGGVVSVLTVVVAICIGHDITRSMSDFRGVVTGLIASAAQAAFSCSVARALKHTKETPLQIMGHYTIMSLILLIPVTQLEPLPSLASLFSISNIVLLGLTGFLNVIVALTAVGSLQLSNPITVNLLGYVKAVAQSLLGVVLLHEPLSINKSIGLGLTIIGSFGYSMSRVFAV